MERKRTPTAVTHLSPKKKKIFEVEEEADVEEDINEVKKKQPRKCTYCIWQGHVAKDCYKRKSNSNGTGSSSSNTGGKGKEQTNGNSRSAINSHTSFTDQERAHFLEYANRAFSMLGNSDGGDNAAPQQTL